MMRIRAADLVPGDVLQVPLNNLDARIRLVDVRPTPEGIIVAGWASVDGEEGELKTPGLLLDRDLECEVIVSVGGQSR